MLMMGEGWYWTHFEYAGVYLDLIGPPKLLPNQVSYLVYMSFLDIREHIT